MELCNCAAAVSVEAHDGEPPLLPPQLPEHKVCPVASQALGRSSISPGCLLLCILRMRHLQPSSTAQLSQLPCVTVSRAHPLFRCRAG
jgi:hypothetical protein